MATFFSYCFCLTFSLVAFPPPKIQGVFGPYDTLNTLPKLAFIPTFLLTALAGYSSAFPGKKAQSSVLILCLEFYPHLCLSFLLSLCLSCLYNFITSGLCYSGGQFIPLVPAGLKSMNLVFYCLPPSCLSSFSLSFFGFVPCILPRWY